MAENVLKQKSYEFAIEVVKTTESIVAIKKEYVLSKQFLKSGTAIGALVREAEFAQSRPDFISKLSIALKEANETLYWLCLLKDTDHISVEIFDKLHHSCKELLSILVASIKTSKSKI